MIEKIVYPEDVIEVTLQYGVNSAMKTFNMTKNEVIKVVKPFVDEIDSLTSRKCQCKEDAKNGMMSMCFMCNESNSRL